MGSLYFVQMYIAVSDMEIMPLGMGTAGQWYGLLWFLNPHELTSYYMAAWTSEEA